jgi:hypothetical protein
VAIYIPARRVAEVRKQGMNAYLGLRLGKIVFGPAVLFVDRVVGLNGHVRKLITAMGNFVADGEIVSGVGK